MKSGNHRRGVRVPFWNRVSKLEFVHGIALTFVSRRLCSCGAVSASWIVASRSALVENVCFLGLLREKDLIPKVGDRQDVLGRNGPIMATRGNMKSVEFKQAALAGKPRQPSSPRRPPASVPAANPTAVMKAGQRSRPVTCDAIPTRDASSRSASPVAAVAAAKGAPSSPRFTAEETILLRGLASGSSSKEMAAQMRLAARIALSH